MTPYISFESGNILHVNGHVKHILDTVPGDLLQTVEHNQVQIYEQMDKLSGVDTRNDPFHTHPRPSILIAKMAVLTSQRDVLRAHAIESKKHLFTDVYDVEQFYHDYWHALITGTFSPEVHRVVAAPTDPKAGIWLGIHARD